MVDQIAIEYVREALADIRKRLKAGSEGPGATLDADDCLKVLACLKEPQRPKGRPTEDSLERAFIAIHCFKLENEGYPVEAAVKATADVWKCGVSTVYAARAAISSK